ncbi:alpha-crystallin A chain [Folsomia candida]|uniref:Alpha-crystallin A chain n=1 Tax=Folsomia candida TaxID=158441 RepID=A0A226DZU9_FOLCA|nr:alpha-crystallin A chain [Folsomia candida]OXA50739.1 Alpha-crystallin A chain [Folsomia candida]
MFPIRSYDPFVNHPFRLFNQNFGTGLLDYDLPSIAYPNWALDHPRRLHTPQQSGFSEVQCTKDKFEVKLDVHQFKPEEVQVTTVDNYVVVEGKHEEKEDPHGFISRQFKRRYLLPENGMMEKVVCNLSSDGVLVITVPRLEAITEGKEKVVAINQTGVPALTNTCAKKGCNKAAAGGDGCGEKKN